MNAMVRRQLRAALGERDARILTNEMDELHRCKVDTEGQQTVDARRRREVRRTVWHALSACARRPFDRVLAAGQHGRSARARTASRDRGTGGRSSPAPSVVAARPHTTPASIVQCTRSIAPAGVGPQEALCTISGMVGVHSGRSPVVSIFAVLSLALGVGAWSTERFNLAERGETDFVDGLLVSGR